MCILWNILLFHNRIQIQEAVISSIQLGNYLLNIDYIQHTIFWPYGSQKNE